MANHASYLGSPSLVLGSSQSGPGVQSFVLMQVTNNQQRVKTLAVFGGR